MAIEFTFHFVTIEISLIRRHFSSFIRRFKGMSPVGIFYILCIKMNRQLPNSFARFRNSQDSTDCVNTRPFCVLAISDTLLFYWVENQWMSRKVSVLWHHAANSWKRFSRFSSHQLINTNLFTSHKQIIIFVLSIIILTTIMTSWYIVLLFFRKFF